MSTSAGANGLRLQTGRASEAMSPRSENSAHQTTATTTATTTPLPTMHPSVIVTSKEEQSAKLLIPAPTEHSVSSPRPLQSPSASPTTATTVAGSKSTVNSTTPNDSRPSASTLGTSTDSKDSGVVTPSSISNQQQRGQSLDYRRKNELIVRQVLERSKVLKASRRLRTRLQYAILKIRRGWSKYTLQEVESLLQPGRSPRISSRSPLKRDRDNVEKSPRQSDRRKPKTNYAYYHQPAYHDLYNDQEDNDEDEDDAPPIQPPMRNSRTRMSLSQFTDSELYQPAKSLISIATSRPDLGYASPYMQAHGSPFYSRPSTQTHSHQGSPSLYHDPLPPTETKAQSATTPWSEYSASETPQTSSGSYMEVDEEDHGTPSEAQVAHTILMLSSPTRPPARTLNQNYIVQMHAGSPTSAPISEWSGSYAPNTSSVHYQPSTASTTPIQSPILSQLPYGQASDQVKGEHEQRSSLPTKPPRLPYISNLYGMTHGPSSPSPLSISTLPPPTDKDDGGSMSRNASPTLKRAVKFAAEHMESGDVHHPSFSESTSSHHHHHHQPYQHSYSASSSPYHSAAAETFASDGGFQRAMTPPPRFGGSYGASSSGAHHGMRTPPPSGDNSVGMEAYHHQMPSVRQVTKGPMTPEAMIQGERIRMTRRNSGLAGGTEVDLRNLYPTTATAQRTSHSSHPHSPAVQQ